MTTEITFKFELESLVCAKPFKNEGRTIIPPVMERYKVLARGYQEGIRPGTKIIDSAIIYHVKLQGVLFKNEPIRVIKETDLKEWKKPADAEPERGEERESGIIM